MKITRYSSSPSYPNFKQRVSKGIVITGFGGSSFLTFANYNDASLAAQAVSQVGEEAGQVFQIFMNDATNAQVSDGYGKKIRRDGRPQMPPEGQFSLFYVPVGMGHSEMVRLFPEMNESGKILDKDSPGIKRLIEDLKQSRSVA